MWVIMSKLANTSESEISMQFLVMNVEMIIGLFIAIFCFLKYSRKMPKYQFAITM